MKSVSNSAERNALILDIILYCQQKKLMKSVSNSAKRNALILDIIQSTRNNFCLCVWKAYYVIF